LVAARRSSFGSVQGRLFCWIGATIDQYSRWIEGLTLRLRSFPRSPWDYDYVQGDSLGWDNGCSKHNSIYVKMEFCYCRALSLEIIEPVIRRNAKKPKGKLTKTDFGKLSEISFVGKSISDIKPLAGLTSATNISLIDNEVVNLKPLAGLEKLEGLQLQGNRIVNLKPLAELTRLDRLNLSRNRITNIAPLKNLVNLERLNLINNNISKITTLAQMPELRWLALNFNQIRNLKPLYGLKNLKVLMLTGNPNLEDSEVEILEEKLPDCKIEY